MFVPLPDGSQVPIESVSVDTEKETLGVWSCPSGNSTKAITSMKEKGQEWLDRAKESKLSRRDVWFLVDTQFWPKVSYGLCCNTSSLQQLTLCLKKQYWQLLPLGGVIRSAPAGMRQTSKGFYGIGCPHVGVECCVAQTNKLLMHYGCPSNLGFFMKISVNFFILELGISLQPFQESFSKYGSWVTHCWIKTLWEKCGEFGVTVQLNDIEISLPREGDKWIMGEFVRSSCYSKNELERLNKVRIHMQVLFISDILGASGKVLDRQYYNRRLPSEKWSKLDFPKEKPPNKDIRLWCSAIRQLVPIGGLPDKLGRLRHEGHKIWTWRHDTINARLLHYRKSGVDVYIMAQHSRRGNRWMRTGN